MKTIKSLLKLIFMIALISNGSVKGNRCGVTEFTARQGEIKTPNYPSNYYSSLNCSYVIKSDSDHEILLSFDDFNLEPHPQCRYDYVNIKGTQINSKTRYCGKNSPNGKNTQRIIKSRANEVIIEFTSDSSTNQRGFRAVWTITRKKSAVTTDCGGELNKESGILTSPGYPKLTGKRKICSWKITVQEGARIKFEFLDLSMQDHYRCSTGYVQLRDLVKSGFDSLGTFCGTTRPKPLISLGNVISVGYYSNKNLNIKGFKARWSTVYAKQTTNEKETLCNKRLTKPTGQIIHQTGHNCSWLIQLAPQMQGLLSVTEINMADDPECKQEIFEARDGRSSSSPILFRTCGDMRPPPVTSSSNYIYVTHIAIKPKKNTLVKMLWQSVDKTTRNDIFNPGSCRISPLDEMKFKYIKTLSRSKDVKPAYVPWIVQLYSRVHCAGMIISPEWIVSAAHCFTKVSSLADWMVRAGDPDFHANERTEQVRGIKGIYIHDKYDSKTFDHDIALIRLKKRLQLNENIKTICLPKKDEVLTTGQECTVAGWGTDKYLSKPKEKLFQVFPKIAGRARCNKPDMYNGKITANMICAGGRGFDTCQGDGGSPLVCVNNDEQYFVVGLSSWGNGCAGKYGVYTDMRKHLDWMKRTIDNNSS